VLLEFKFNNGRFGPKISLNLHLNVETTPFGKGIIPQGSLKNDVKLTFKRIRLPVAAHFQVLRQPRPLDEETPALSS
jgi:hypothetical protein